MAERFAVGLEAGANETGQLHLLLSRPRMDFVGNANETYTRETTKIKTNGAMINSWRVAMCSFTHGPHPGNVSSAVATTAKRRHEYV